MGEQHKIVFTGAVGAGKTTAIRQLSDVEPITTEQLATDHTKEKKQYTTVAMDYGSMRLPNGNTVHLYGTPGQERFDFIWKVLVEGCIGLVIMVDHSNPDPLGDLRFFLKSFEKFIKSHAIVVGVTHMNYGRGPKLADYHQVLLENDLNPALFEVDARKQKDVIVLVQALLYSLDPGLVDEHVETVNFD